MKMCFFCRVLACVCFERHLFLRFFQSCFRKVDFDYIFSNFTVDCAQNLGVMISFRSFHHMTNNQDTLKKKLFGSFFIVWNIRHYLYSNLLSLLCYSVSMVNQRSEDSYMLSFFCFFFSKSL